MEDEFNNEAASEFNESEPRADIKMFLDALISDQTALEQLAIAIQPFLVPEEVTEPTEIEEEEPQV